MDSKVQRAIEMASAVDPTRLLDQELPRLESLFGQMQGTNDPNLRQVVEGLDTVYRQALRMVKAAADAMRYGPMDSWPDTKPLEAVAELHPVLWGADWYQRMLGQVLMPVNHPWYVLPTET
jgi:hypothetical protein